MTTMTTRILATRKNPNPIAPPATVDAPLPKPVKRRLYPPVPVSAPDCLPVVTPCAIPGPLSIPVVVGRDCAPESNLAHPCDPPEKPTRLEAVIDVVCAMLRVDRQGLASKSKHWRITLAREVIVYVARKHTTASYPDIARACGSPNHSTSISAMMRIESKLFHDPSQTIGTQQDPQTVSINDLVVKATTKARALSRGTESINAVQCVVTWGTPGVGGGV